MSRNPSTGLGARLARIFHPGMASASARADDARREVQVSQERLERLRAEVIQPLREAGERNQFADMIRASLLEGKHR